MRGFKHGLWLLITVFQLTTQGADLVWQRVVVIGASASGGFVLTEPFGGTATTKCKLNYYLDAAIAKPHAPVKNFGTALFFLNPDALGPQQVEAATNARPTLVVAVDFLFWFCCGDGDTDAERAEHFETGLKLLEHIPCPLIVGDIPDASSATNTGIISAAQVPSETARRAANERLKQWAAANPRVTVMPLAKFMRAVKANEAIKIRDLTLPAGKTRELLQADGLHPNPRGAAVLSLGIWDTFITNNKKIPARDIHWDVEAVFRSGYAVSNPATRK
jgi:hypothetical protein